jgi:putative cell wall-binding protein
MKRTLIAMLTLAMFVAMVPAPALGGVESIAGVDENYAAGDEFAVVVEEGHQNQLELWGDMAVFRDSRFQDGCDENKDIWAVDLSTGIQIPIDLSSGMQNNPSVYNDIVVWADKEDDEVMMKDLSTGETKVLGEGGCNPFVWGTTVVWSEWQEGADPVGGEAVLESGGWYDLVEYDLLTDTESVATTTSGCSPMPELYGSKMIYKDRSDEDTECPRGQIRVYDLATDTDTLVSDPAGVRAWSPSIWGDWAVWYQSGDEKDSSSIQAYNLSTTERKTIASGTASYGCTDISEGIVVFVDDRNCEEETSDLALPQGDESGEGMCDCEEVDSDELAEPTIEEIVDPDPEYTGLDIFGYDLNTDQEFAICEAPGKQKRPRIFEGTVIWMDKRGCALGWEPWTGYDIYGVQLEPMYSQVYGDDRFDTAVESARKSFPNGADTVVIATGFNWPDALAASSLAGAVDGPVLLTRRDSLPPVTAVEIERMGASNAYIIGGTDAISQQIEDDLAIALDGDVVRIHGPERRGTANEIARETVRVLGDSYDGRALVVTALNYPDALCAAPIAAYDGVPIFLAGADGIAQSTKETMLELEVAEVMIVGGENAVSAATKAQLEALFDVRRTGGATRYDTAANMAQFGVDEVGLSWDGLAFATGRDFPDALTGGVMQGRLGSTLLLTPSYYLHTAPKVKIQTHKAEIPRVKFLGGDAAISQAVRDEIETILEP